MKDDSPCTDICRYEPGKGWCVGCGRTDSEIKAWRKMSPFQKTRLLGELRHRMKKMAATER